MAYRRRVFVDRLSPLPLYEQIAEVLRSEIVAGVYPPGASLPAEDAIGDRLGVGRMAVRRALAELRHEGLITSEQGRLSTVRPSCERVFLDLAAGTEVTARMPSLPERRELRLPAGVPVLELAGGDQSVERYPADRFGIRR